ncbi:endonuclease/exonuclease/phosphatase family protein [Rapidithrix thailandica]|uniref:Endonuclease/exonuclease/phosphatase family protein n=1 Tax=Rapidithrix thailandica TaxID=413964 RepID=A0AAW9S4P0_9BACT
MTYNIYHGETMKGDFDLDYLAETIEQHQPDLVAMQEVDFKTQRAKGMDLVTELGYRLKMQGVFGKAMSFDGGEYGEGVLSKFSFAKTQNFALSCSEGKEPRAALAVWIQLPAGDTICFVGTHLDHTKDPADRITQAKELNQLFANPQYPTVLAGDLNASPDSKPIKTLKKQWKLTSGKNPEPTYSVENPRVKIDYIMTHKNHKWKVIETQVIKDKIASDHCGYVVTLELED